ncbi:FHA domain-containing protein [Streptomyces sp. NPDC005728]|uniref:FHA domain-containing protein n=1 Tax=Streptomyces sp. NPDC005728 TaxID=3157054 RepID=UPI0033FE6520
MQIRLTVVDPLGPSPQRGRSASRDVLVTAPAGTDLSAVASALAAAVTGDGGTGRDAGSAAVVLYAGAERLDPRRCALGEPPLVDGAVLSLGAPAAPEPHPELDDAPTQLHVVAGPDAGGVHLLHGGRITVGRSADADVPLDDPDVSRLHCAVTVAADGRVSVADLGSTNGTALDGTRVSDRPVRFPPGALLRIGESALRVTPSVGPGARVRTAPDGEGSVRVALGGEEAGPGEAGGFGGDPAPGAGGGSAAGSSGGAGAAGSGAGARGAGSGTTGSRTEAPGSAAAGAAGHARVEAAPGTRAHGPSGPTHHTYGTASWGASGGGAEGQEHRRGEEPVVPGQAGAPRIESRAGGAGAPGAASGGGTDAGRHGAGGTGSSPSAPARPGAASSGDDMHAGRHESGGPVGAHPAAGMPGSASDGRNSGTGRSGAGRSGGESSAHGRRPGSASRGGDTHAGRYGVGGPDGIEGAYAGGARPVPDSESSGAPAGSGSGREDTPLRGTDVPQGGRRRGGLGAWARRLTGGRSEQPSAGQERYGATEARTPAAEVPQLPEAWPDPAALLLTALGPGPRLWERTPGHPEALTVRLGTADRNTPDGSGVLPAVPVTAALREAGALGLAGPRPRLSGLARAALAQLAALHSPDLLEVVLISADRSRPEEERTAEWSWLGWLPHVRPGHGQDCRLLLAYDREQAAARTEELLRRVEEFAATGRGSAQPAAARTAQASGRPGPDPDATGNPASATTAHAAPDQGAHSVARAESAPASPRRPSWARESAELDAMGGFPGPYTVVVVDGDPGGSSLQESLARLAVAGPRAGIHVVCLAETTAVTPASPVAQAYEAACAVTPTLRHCGAVALLSGEVAGTLHLMRVAPTGPVGAGALATVDAVSPAWAERFARALAPLRPDGPVGERHARVAVPLPQSARLLDELGLARATPASLMARWADAADDTESLGGRARAVLGAGPRGPLTADLVADGPHLLIEGPAGSGRTELLRAVVASLAAAERPDRLGMVLIDGRDGVGTGAGRGEGLRVCTDIPHVTTHLIANDPVRMREFAQSLSAELKRRAELLGRTDFAQWHAGHEVSGRIVAQRSPNGRPAVSGTGDIETPPSSTLRLRPGGAARRRTEAAPPLPRLVVVVDDLDALVSPALGSPGRPAAGSVMRALEAVAREGERLGVHLVTAAGSGGRTAETEPARRAALRVALDAPAAGPAAGPDEPAPGRGRLTYADGRAVGFQGGRVTGRIPRTATQRPTVVPLEWQRMGDPPTRRPVRELGNGPTDLALLASAVERAAREVAAAEVPSLL